MTDTYWLKQNKNKPLFPDMQWSRPENKKFAGKLLIIGGEAHSFSVPAEAYGIAMHAGIGQAQVALPEQARTLVPEPMRPMIHFLPGITNGSFAKASLAELTDLASWSDTTILAGGVGRNSETMATLVRFTQLYDSRLVVTGDAVQAFLQEPEALLQRENTLVAATIGELQKLLKDSSETVLHSDGLPALADKLHRVTVDAPVGLMTCLNDMVMYAHKGRVSSTPADEHVWRLTSAVKSAVWWSQFADRPFEAVTTALVT